MSTMPPSRQRGFSIVAAVFILVVLAALGGFVVTVSSTQHVGTALDVQGARAYQAARAGAEWGAYAVLSVPSGATHGIPSFGDPCAPPGGAGTSSTYLTIDGFGVTVQCDSTFQTDGSTFHIYQITSTACSPASGACPNTSAVGTLSYVERRVSITVTDSQ